MFRPAVVSGQGYVGFGSGDRSIIEDLAQNVFSTERCSSSLLIGSARLSGPDIAELRVRPHSKNGMAAYTSLPGHYAFLFAQKWNEGASVILGRALLKETPSIVDLGQYVLLKIYQSPCLLSTLSPNW
jgi:hypothetical protein